MDNHTLFLGVTGGMGAGKSAVCELLQKKGAIIFNADQIAKYHLAHHPDVKNEVIQAFGPKSYDESGQPDTAYLARIAFSSVEKVSLLNNILHPRVGVSFKKAQLGAKQKNIPVLVKEAALLFETGGNKLVDYTLLVDAPLATRIKRIQERSGLSLEQIHSRLKYQWDPAILREQAHYVIDNTGTPADLSAKVDELWNKLLLLQTK